MKQIRKFPKSIIEKLGYYVYILIDPKTNKVFYVGKGKGNRIFAHINGAISSPLASHKLEKIRSIQSKGLKVKHKIVRHGLTDEEAFEVEASLIDFIGIRELTNLVHGHHSDNRGLMDIAEVIAQYNAPKISIKVPAMLITVNKLFERRMNDEELYATTRGNWVLSKRRIKAKFAFAVYNGIVRQVYEIQEWKSVTARRKEQKTQKRWQFKGFIAKDLQHYVGSSVEKYITAGARNPIKYVNC